MDPLWTSSPSCLTSKEINVDLHATSSSEEQLRTNPHEDIGTAFIPSELYCKAEKQGNSNR